MSGPALTWHRRAERWVGWVEFAGWRGRSDLRVWCLRRALRAERAALAELVTQHPERVRTIEVITHSVETLEARVAEGDR